MKIFTLFVALALGRGVLSLIYDNPKCNANNCARAVTGTRPGKVPDITSRVEDCSSFLLVTVTPATSTATATKTVTTTISVEYVKRNGILANRQITVYPTAVPYYASACPDTSAYSSACSCWGITASTTTAPTPVTTTTTTVTSTVTVSACPPGQILCGSTCEAVSTDPNNCGACGNVCASGICVNGACSNPTCNGASCGAIQSCTGDCFCFRGSGTVGFCGENTPCADDPLCSSDADCPLGSVCAVDTCCGVSICLTVCTGQSGTKLKRGMRFDERTIGGTNSSYPAGVPPHGL